jgi:CheY-like chemotaxis protein
MPFKRALVVDDSKSARVALKDLLERYDLTVDFAKSGEEALEFLKFQLVDVVFMDHTMPGMDGLEAVAAIKGDPRTATIPVMMYTTKEGEVYVSQARALGAVGVVPKEVQPGVLFNMLLELGLVEDRRTGGVTEANEGDQRSDSLPSEPVVDVDEAPATADASLRAVVTQVMEDQHHVLRAAIVRGQRNAAREVADEIFARLADGAVDADEALATEQETAAASRRSMVMWAVLLLIPGLVLGGFYFDAARDRDRAIDQLRQIDARAADQLNLAESVTTDLMKDMKAQREATLSRHLAALAWALNGGGDSPFHEQLFNGRRAALMERLVNHLRSIDFEGTVRLTSHLGEFCLAEDDEGALSLADPAMSIDDCALIGHPLDDSGLVSAHQTLEFADFLSSAALLNARGISVEVVANDRSGSVRRFPFPSEVTTAGEWNRIAALNNRVEFELVADR